MTIANLFNSAWMWQCRPEASRYERAADDVQRTQSALLRQILARNAASEYGRKYCFSRILAARQFQSQVPVCSYELLSESIDRIAGGQTGVLTREPVRMFEPTSGSAGPEKLIPYTRSLKRQFQRAISAWAWDTLAKRPALRRGSSYWSLSPAFGRQRTTPGGLAIGFEDDTHYLSLSQRLASAWTLAVSPAVARLHNLDNFRYSTLLQLLRTSDLTMISVWSPTFLLALLANLEDWWPAICFDLSRGTVTWPAPQAVDSAVARKTRLRNDPRRADCLTSIFRSSGSRFEKLSGVWPSLGLISCWTDGAAAQYLPELRGVFPDVEIQSKGLIATEGVVSIPRMGRTGTALALRSHFFEFQEEPSAGEGAVGLGSIRLAHELEADRTYRVILTTGGGFYRYQLGDLIQVLGFWRRCPLIRFLGRSAATSDLVGEKLHELHVREVLQSVFAAKAITPGFSLLAPVADKPPRYVLYVQGHGIESTVRLCQELAKGLRNGLEQNPYYRHAIQMGQLGDVEVIVLDPTGESAWRVYERGCVANGQRPGDIKPVALHSSRQWDAALALSGISVGRSAK